MADEAIDGGHGHGWIGEDLVPLAERLIAGDGEALALVSLGDEFAEHGGLSLIVPNVAQIIEDEAIELVELGKASREEEIAPGQLPDRSY